MFSIVLECVETSLAKFVTQNLNILTIGIGASKYCDGQILVIDDLIGLNPTNYRFVKKYANIRNDISKAVSNYSKEVKKLNFQIKKILINQKYFLNSSLIFNISRSTNPPITS